MNSAHYFIGISLPPMLKEYYAKLQEDLKQKVSYKQWTNPNDFHITLKFLGAANKQQLNHLQKNLSCVCDSQKFSIQLGGIGTFGNPSSPRVMWIGVEKTNSLENLQNMVERCAIEAAFPKENRPYHPHITLAKKWDSKATSYVVKEIKQQYVLNEQKLDVHEVHLFQIRPQKIPKYEPIVTYTLSGDKHGTINKTI